MRNEKEDEVMKAELRCIAMWRIRKLILVLLPAVLGILCFVGTEQVLAGDIFTREQTKVTYPMTRSIALKSPMLETEGLIYCSTDREVAMVTKDGVIMSVGSGECDIIAIAPDGTQDICHVTVEEPGTGHKQVALTFDDGPGYYGQELLDYLSERDVHVTFFYIGNQVSSYKDNVYRAYNDGHEIGNHSYTHPSLSTGNVDKIKNEIGKCDEAIHSVTGAYPTVFRPPYGAKGDTLLKNCNYPVILWSVDTLDWKNRDADWVSAQVHDGAIDGAVILVHEIHKTTIAGIKIAVDRLLEEGWEFVTITELWERDGYKLENGTVYGRKKD